ncbi:hypothetical protein JOM56_006373 [Amanita muscaria]
MQALSDASYASSSASRQESSTFKDDNLLYTDTYPLDRISDDRSQLSVPVRDVWYMRCGARLRARAPHAFNKLARLALYIRGPRPKLDLEGPIPSLDRLYQFRHLRFTLSLESKFSRSTAVFAAPWVLVILGAAYIIGLSFFARAQSFLTPSGSYLRCTSSFWFDKDGCGIDGLQCLPFNYSSFDFRCPAQCNNVILQNPRTVGDQQMAYVPLVVGGGDANHTYRGDSFICSAAVQAGVISSSRGGCASLQLVQNFTNFIPYTANGLTSIGFPTIFPISYTLSRSTSFSHCDDLRDPALGFNAAITFLLFTVFRPKPLVLFWCLVCIGFWHVTLFSQPLGPPPQISTGFGTFLPALFVAYMFWRTAFCFTLPSFSKAPIESAFLYLLPYWVGVLHNLTLDELPLSRLTASDVTKRSGAIAVLVVGLIIITALLVNQARVIRKTGWLPYYLGWYILGGMVMMVLALLPGVELRIHHYILAMMLMPLTGFPTRLSAICQGLLLGLFLNGTAAFGFASIVQTPAQLLLDAPIGSILPTFLTNSTNYNGSISFSQQIISWAAFPEGQGWDSYALLVDDVERYVGAATNYSLAALDATVPHFFRLAFSNSGTAGDFTMPAVLWPNGTWVDALPGPS